MMKDLLNPLKPVTDVRELGTGRERTTVFAVDENDRIVFRSHVLHNNYYSYKTVEFANRNLYQVVSQMINGKRVRLFTCSERLDCEWNKQCAADPIMTWIQSARVKDIFAFENCIATMQGREQEDWQYYAALLDESDAVERARVNIFRYMRFMSVEELRRLALLIQPS
jgi:hypothetical protein